MNHLPRFREPDPPAPAFPGHEYTWTGEMALTVDGVTVAVLDITALITWQDDGFVVPETVTVSSQHVGGDLEIPCLTFTGWTAASQHMHGLKAAVVDAVADHLRAKWTEIERKAFEDAMSKMEDA